MPRTCHPGAGEALLRCELSEDQVLPRARSASYDDCPFPLPHLCWVPGYSCKRWRKPKRITPSYTQLLTAAAAMLSGGGRGDAAGRDRAWQGLLCHLRGCHGTRFAAGWAIPGDTGLKWQKEMGERKMEREAGSYIRSKSHTTAISSIFATDLNKSRLGAIWSKAHPASAPFTVLSPPSSACHNIQVSPPSGCSHTVAGVHQQSREPPGVCLPKQGAREGRREKKKSVFALTYNP